MQTSRGTGDGFAIDLRAIYEFVLDHAVVIAACTGLGVIAAGFIAFRSPKVYTARTVIQVEHDSRQVLTIGERTRGEERGDDVLLKTVEQNLTQPDLLLRLIHRHGLLNDPAFFAGEPRPISDARIVRALSGQISARVERGTRLIEINVENESPALAQKIATLLVQEYLNQNVDASLTSATETNQYLWKEAARLRDKLAASEGALQKYREENQTVSLEDRQNIVVERLSELNKSYTAANSERLRLESDRTLVQNLMDEPMLQMLSVPSIASIPAVIELRKVIAEKEAALAILAQRYKREHPKHLAATTELTELRQTLEKTLEKAAVVIETTYSSAHTTEQKLQNALREQEQRALELERIAIPYQGLVRDVESDRALYQEAVKRLKETDASRGASETAVRVITRPLLPDKPSKPNKMRILILGMLGGLGAGCTVGFARRAIDTTFRSVNDAEQRTGLPVVGVLPRHAARLVRGENAALPVVHDPHSAVTESFRTLRTTLTMAKSSAVRTSFLFTSAMPGEGKSFCASNCASSFAQIGLRTLLIDADLRRPSIAQIFFGETRQRGLSEYLAGEISFEEAIQPTPVENLFVMPAGRPHSVDPSDVLAHEKFKRVLAAARGKFDRIVVDSAPVNAVSDSLLLVKDVESINLVVLAGKTPADTVAHAIRKLTDAGAPAVGCVLNQVSLRRTDGYYYAGYGDGYSSEGQRRGPSAAAGAVGNELVSA